MTWQQAHDLLRSDFTPPPIPYTDEPARFPCGKCEDAFFAADVLLEHQHQKHPGMFHGTRARYLAGCHCRRCGRANTAYKNRPRPEKAEPVYEMRPSPLYSRMQKVRIA